MIHKMAALPLLAGVALSAAPAFAIGFEHITTGNVRYFCQTETQLAAWMDAGNIYGPAVLGVPEAFKCTDTKEPVPITNVAPIAIVRGFKTIVVVITAESEKGRIYSFVPFVPQEVRDTGRSA